MSTPRTITIAAGPEGPRSLRPERRKQVAGTTKRIVAACDEMIGAGRRPSIQGVVDASGLGRTTVTRRRYAPLLAKGRTRFARVASGMSLEEAHALEAEEVRQAGAQQVAEGEGEETDESPCDREALEDRGDLGNAQRGGGPTGEDEAALRRSVAELEARVANLSAEVERRDGQLYHALGLVWQRGRTLRWHRAKLREVTAIAEALGAEPLTPRPQRRWTEDMEAEFYEDDDDATNEN